MRNLLLSGLIAVSLLGFSYLTSIIYADGAFERWHSLGAPPEGIGEIASVYFDARSEATIVLNSADNQLLQQGARSTCGAAGCWRQVDTIPGGFLAVLAGVVAYFVLRRSAKAAPR
jgi:hypothetical protein